MFRVVANFFAAQLCVRDYWCASTARMPGAVTTPSGKKAVLFNVGVDVWYSIERGNIQVRTVRLAKGGNCIGGAPINVATSRGGEAWHATSLSPQSVLDDVVARELSLPDSPLRRIMFARWLEKYEEPQRASLAHLLNSRRTAAEIARALSVKKDGIRIAFSYTADGKTTERDVVAYKIVGNSIRAKDLNDRTTKCFRLDRIRDAY